MITKTKRLNPKRSITIPKDIAYDAGFFGGEGVDVTSHKGIITIKRHVPVCRFCGSTENAKTYDSIDCCPECAKKLREAVK